MSTREPQLHSNSHSLSTFQTRSLRDIQTTLIAPPTRPEKSRRRVTQVHGLHPVQRVSSPDAAICPPSTEQIQAPPIYMQSVSSSSMHVSSPSLVRANIPLPPIPTSTSSDKYRRTPSRPKTIAVHKSGRTISDVNSIALTRSATLVPVPELRRPPIDPRKSRRYCSDFSLGRDNGFTPLVLSHLPTSPLIPDNSSMSSTPLATYAETESDSDTSSNLDFLFPQPPSIDQSVSLRRMHSSPLFNSEETKAVRNGLKKHWSAKPQGPNRRMEPHMQHDTRLHEISRDIGQVFKQRSSPSPKVAPVPRQPLESISSIPIVSRSDHPAVSPWLPSSPQRNNGTPQGKPPNTLLGQNSDPSHIGPLRSSHTEREPASVRPSAKFTPTISSGRSRPLPTSSFEALGRLELSIEKLKTYDPQQGQRSHEYKHEVYLSPNPITFKPPSLASAGRRKPMHQSHLSVPLAGPGSAHINETAHESTTQSLETPFNHHPTRSQHVVYKSRTHQEPMPKSFMDITPEQDAYRESASHARKERVRKLLARASSGVLGWGKSLTRKGNIPK